MELVQNGRSLLRKFRENGYVLMVFSTFVLSLGAFFVKLVTTREHITVFEVVFFRSFINVVLVLIYARTVKQSLRGNNKTLLVVRSIIGFLAFTCFFTAISKINLADAVILFYTAPVFVTILSIFFLRDKISFPLLVSILLALFGAVLVIKPSFDFFNSGGMYGILAAMLAGCVFVMIRKLSATNSALAIVFWFSLISTLLALPLTIADFVVPSVRAIFYLCSIGLCATLGQLCMTKGYRYLTAQKGSAISMFNVVVSAFLSYFILHEAIDRYTVIGGLLVFSSTIGIFLLRPVFFHKHPNRTF